MPPAWHLELVDRVLHVDLGEAVEAGDFERLYDAILAEMATLDEVRIDVGTISLTPTGGSLLDLLVANLRSRGLRATVTGREDR
jgi:hypothetical protein